MGYEHYEPHTDKNIFDDSYYRYKFQKIKN